MTGHDAGQVLPGDPQVPKARSAQELHQAALELMKKKHRDMGLIEDVIR